MSCRRQLEIPPPATVCEAPSSVRKWQRWPSSLPRACNDNPGGVANQVRTFLAAMFGGLLALATAVGTFEP